MSSTFIWDREIPVRSAINFDYAHHQLTTPSTNRSSRPSYYKDLLSTLINDGRGSRILAFNNCKRALLYRKPPLKPRLISFYDKLDAPGLSDSFYTNLLNWGSSDVIAIAIKNTVFMLSGRKTWTLAPNDATAVTSVSWNPNGRLMAVGLENSNVQLWDPVGSRLIATLRGVHDEKPIGSLSWSNGSVLTTGGEDGCVIDKDLRVSSHVVRIYRGHRHECSICGLEWSNSSPEQLASGGSDNVVCVWDQRNPNRWLHRLTDQVAGVRALAWCPFKDKLLATGGGTVDGCVRFWNTQSGACVDSLRVGSEVCALMWSKNSQELLTSCRFARDNLTLWAYPEMVRTGQLVGHTDRVLLVAQSPDGSRVATASGGEDKTFRLWRNVFLQKTEPPVPFRDSYRVLIRGMHLCRTLSYNGAEFEVVEVPLRKK